MKNFQKKKILKHTARLNFFLVFLGVVVFVFIFSVFSFMGKMEETIKNRKIVENKVAELEKTKEKLNSDISKLKTEKGIEESIREKFGLAKEGENMILVIEDKNLLEAMKEDDSGGFFSFLKNLFK